MSEIDTASLPPEPSQRLRNARGAGFLRRTGTILRGGIMVGCIAVGAGGLALAASGPEHFGWRHGPRPERIQRMVVFALDSVGATSAQEAKVHDIIAAAITAVMPDPQEHEALRKKVLELMRAPTIDRAAVEKLRAERVAAFEAKSKTVVKAALDAADQLTPEQRSKLADRIEAMMQHGPMGGHHGPMDEDHGPGDDRGGKD